MGRAGHQQVAVKAESRGGQYIGVMVILATILWSAVFLKLAASVGGSRLKFVVTTNTSAGATSPTMTSKATPVSYRLPKLIHQTVKNKSNVSCQEQEVIKLWKQLNPGYTHTLYDDSDIRAFVEQHYPQLVPMPFNYFLTGVERADLFRVLVVHKFEGVYADMDVWPLKPIDEWNAGRNHDAALLLGVEHYYPERNDGSTLPLEITNWAFAGMPGHPLLGSMPDVIAKTIQEQFFQLAKSAKPADAYHDGILNRTGPRALTRALHIFSQQAGVGLAHFAESNITSRSGLKIEDVRVLPQEHLGGGWEVAGKELGACEEFGKQHARALVCHMFWGSWKPGWSLRPSQTYGSCAKANGTEIGSPSLVHNGTDA